MSGLCELASSLCASYCVPVSALGEYFSANSSPEPNVVVALVVGLAPGVLNYICGNEARRGRTHELVLYIRPS